MGESSSKKPEWRVQQETRVGSGIEEPRFGEDYIRAQRGASEPAKGGAWSARSLPGGGSTTFFLQLLEGPESPIKVCDVPNIKQGYIIYFENQQIAIRQTGKKVVDGVSEIKCNT